MRRKSSSQHRPRPPPTPPEVTVVVGAGRGDNVFRTDDEVGELTPCTVVEDLPAQIVLTAGDSGGIAAMGLRMVGGSPVDGTIELIPPPPETSSTVTGTAGAGRVQIDATPSAAGSVRTGIVAVFDVDGSFPMGLRAWARDTSGNFAEMHQIEVRSLNEADMCIVE